MIVGFALLIVFGIVSYLVSMFMMDTNLSKSTVAFFGGALVGISIVMIIMNHEPTVIDYMRGRVDVNIQETYIDSVLVKRDTIITYKK